jgi:hypothetical protein
MIRLIVFAIIGIVLARMFWDRPKPKKAKPIVVEIKEVQPENKAPMLSRIFGSNNEDEQAYKSYVESHSKTIKAFYYVRRYSMRKTGYHALVSVYIVKPENYYGYIQCSTFEVLEADIENKVVEIVRRSYAKSQIVISKLR